MPKNVILISVDDMIDVVRYRGAFGTELQTPNIDRLMEMGTRFENAMSPTPICSPARASLITSKSPFATGVVMNDDRVQDLVPVEDTIFGAFGDRFSWSEGKIIHAAGGTSSQAYVGSAFDHFLPPEPGSSGAAVDRATADHAAAFLASDAAAHPFFMSVGLTRPHGPWTDLPQEFYDIYDISEIDVPEIAGLTWDDLPDFFKNIIHKPNSNDHYLKAGSWEGDILHYLAAVSFADAQIGKVLDALDAGGLWDKTTVAFFSDHGYHLGDRGVWHKFTLWEEAASIPLIIADPDLERGAVDPTPASLLDIWPTVAALSGIDAPADTDGVDLTSDHGRTAVITTAFGSVSIRTAEWRYTLYHDGEEELFGTADIEHAAPIDAPDAGLLSEMRTLMKAEMLYQYGVILADATDAVGPWVRGGADDDTFILVGDAAAKGYDGDDIYHVTEDGIAVEGRGRGTDTVIVSMRGGEYRLGANIENGQMEIHSDGLLIGNRLGNALSAGVGKGGTEIRGNGGHDLIHGNDRADTLSGGRGHDTIYGDRGNDDLRGGRGADVLDGGKSDDVLKGGRGADTFVFKAGYGDDVVRDFGRGRDSLDIDWETVDSVEQVGDDVVIEIGHDTLTLVGTDLDAVF